MSCVFGTADIDVSDNQAPAGENTALPGVDLMIMMFLGSLSDFERPVEQ